MFSIPISDQILFDQCPWVLEHLNPELVLSDNLLVAVGLVHWCIPVSGGFKVNLAGEPLLVLVASMGMPLVLVRNASRSGDLNEKCSFWWPQ